MPVPAPAPPASESPASPLSARAIRFVRRALCEWFGREARDLPWRRTRDPYRIWLSESMLQQTRVDTVVPYYEAFLQRFPTVQALADADLPDVLRAWAGLGYYSRARNLKRAAEIVARDHGGELPRDPAELRRLPGIGPYTAGAIRSIAFRQRAALVDGNVTRVLSRVTARARLLPAELWSLAETLVPEDRPDVFNQALMELGATLCTPRAPRCEGCPVERMCGARTLGDPQAYPEPRKRPAPRPVRALGAIVECGVRPRRLLVLRRPSRGLLGGLWEVPTLEGRDPAPLVESIERRTGIEVTATHSIGRVRHVFSHRDLTLELVRFEVHRPPRRRIPLRAAEQDELRWCAHAELAQLPMSRLMDKILERI